MSGTSPNRHSEQYSRQWARALEIHVFPAIGNLSVAALDLAAVRKVLEPIWYEMPRVAQVVRANVESLLNFAQAEGQRTGDNPARWDLLKHSLPARKGARMGGHFRALSYSDMPALLKAVERQSDAISALCMRFTILTMARTKESTACRWAEIDFAARTRGVQILKGGREPWQHQVPLSEQASELLRGLLVDGKASSEYVFPSHNRRDHIGRNAMLSFLARIGWADRTTTHGIWTAFKTWATERTNYPREVVELCLSHLQGDALERAYQRGDIIEKRRRLMQEWADFCTTGVDAAASSNVVAIRA
jgi:integrase